MELTQTRLLNPCFSRSAGQAARRRMRHSGAVRKLARQHGAGKSRPCESLSVSNLCEAEFSHTGRLETTHRDSNSVGSAAQSSAQGPKSRQNSPGTPMKRDNNARALLRRNSSGHEFTINVAETFASRSAVGSMIRHSELHCARMNDARLLPCAMESQWNMMSGGRREDG